MSAGYDDRALQNVSYNPPLLQQKILLTSKAENLASKKCAINFFRMDIDRQHNKFIGHKYSVTYIFTIEKTAKSFSLW